MRAASASFLRPPSRALARRSPRPGLGPRQAARRYPGVRPPGCLWSASLRANEASPADFTAIPTSVATTSAAVCAPAAIVQSLPVAADDELRPPSTQTSRSARRLSPRPRPRSAAPAMRAPVHSTFYAGRLRPWTAPCLQQRARVRARARRMSRRGPRVRPARGLPRPRNVPRSRPPAAAASVHPRAPPARRAHRHAHQTVLPPVRRARLLPQCHPRAGRLLLPSASGRLPGHLPLLCRHVLPGPLLRPARSAGHTGV